MIDDNFVYPIEIVYLRLSPLFYPLRSLAIRLHLTTHLTYLNFECCLSISVYVYYMGKVEKELLR